MSWAHQRTRELADQLLDDAQTFRQRCTDCVAGLRRAGLAAVATLDAGWVVGESIGRMHPGQHDDDD